MAHPTHKKSLKFKQLRQPASRYFSIKDSTYNIRTALKKYSTIQKAHCYSFISLLIEYIISSVTVTFLSIHKFTKDGLLISRSSCACLVHNVEADRCVSLVA